MTDRDAQAYAIIGAAMGVHSTLGHGFLESVYQEALAVEMHMRSIPFRREVVMPVTYKGTTLACSYRADFVCFDAVIIEVKAVARLSAVEEAQVLNYLKVSRLPKALLLNFGASSLERKRLVM
ncbi:GxxExxY protein [Asticcacaulis sp. W401b]|uniref:GxxExxY protein n=1 Tax=Asticcacaulis sp. W401b TaxID=3388666 RepID=UPI0039704DB3